MDAGSCANQACFEQSPVAVTMLHAAQCGIAAVTPEISRPVLCASRRAPSLSCDGVCLTCLLWLLVDSSLGKPAKGNLTRSETAKGSP